MSLVQDVPVIRLQLKPGPATTDAYVSLGITVAGQKGKEGFTVGQNPVRDVILKVQQESEAQIEESDSFDLSTLSSLGVDVPIRREKVNEQLYLFKLGRTVPSTLKLPSFDKAKTPQLW